MSLFYALAGALILLLVLNRRRVAWAVGPSESDDSLVARVRKGDHHAFNVLVGRYQGMMYNLAYRIMGDEDAAADVTQDGFVTAYKKINQYTEGNFKAWLARVVRNQCFDALRYRQRRPATSLEALVLDGGDERGFVGEESHTIRPEELVLRGEVSAWLERAILELPADQRATLIMADIHEYSYDEIALAMEVELGTVKSRLFRARRKLRELLQDKSELLPAQYRS